MKRIIVIAVLILTFAVVQNRLCAQDASNQKEQRMGELKSEAGEVTKKKSEMAGNEADEQKLKKKDVPKSVLAAFKNTYPNAKAKGYSKEEENGKTTYEVESVEGKTKRDVTFDGAGAVVSVEETVAPSELPEALRTVIKEQYSGSKTVGCEKITEGGSVKYEIVFKSGKKKKEVTFTSEGEVLGSEKK